MIKVEQVTKTYGAASTAVHALHDASLSIDEGEIVFLGGPSGSGKSTLLHLIGGLDRPTSGEIWLRGTRLSELTDQALTDFRARHIGFIFQNFHLLPVLTVFENVEYPLTLTRQSQRQGQVISVLEEVGLSEFAHYYPNQLSGGQRQRVAIARALVTKPKLIIADEPTANLDSINGEKVIHLMRDLAKRHGSTLVICTHNEQLLDTAERVVLLRDGSVTEDRRHKAFSAYPANSQAAKEVASC